MNLSDLTFLQSDVATRQLKELAKTPFSPQTHLKVLTRLRNSLTATQAAAVVETWQLRQKAVKKFSKADAMFFTRPALEQASAEVVSSWRSRRFAAAGFKQVADCCCSIGGDALALAGVASVTGLEKDPVRLAMAEWNVGVYGFGPSFQAREADVTCTDLQGFDAFFCDPARRDASGQRRFDPDGYLPPFSLIQRWRRRIPHSCTKLGPGIPYEAFEEGNEVEFISVEGELREAVEWSGDLKSGAGRRATLLPAGRSLVHDPAVDGTIPVEKPKSWLIEPDRAVIRAHLIETLAAKIGATRIDSQIAYLSSVDAPATEFGTSFFIEETLPFDEKKIRQYLRARKVGHLEIRKRGVDADVPALLKRLRGKGSEGRVLFLTRVRDERVAIVCLLPAQKEMA